MLVDRLPQFRVFDPKPVLGCKLGADRLVFAAACHDKYSPHFPALSSSAARTASLSRQSAIWTRKPQSTNDGERPASLEYSTCLPRRRPVKPRTLPSSGCTYRPPWQALPFQPLQTFIQLLQLLPPPLLFPCKSPAYPVEPPVQRNQRRTPLGLLPGLLPAQRGSIHKPDDDPGNFGPFPRFPTGLRLQAVFRLGIPGLLLQRRRPALPFGEPLQPLICPGNPRPKLPQLRIHPS